MLPTHNAGLPPEVWTSIFHFLDVNGLVACLRVNHFFYDLAVELVQKHVDKTFQSIPNWTYPTGDLYLPITLCYQRLQYVSYDRYGLACRNAFPFNNTSGKHPPNCPLCPKQYKLPWRLENSSFLPLWWPEGTFIHPKSLVNNTIIQLVFCASLYPPGSNWPQQVLALNHTLALLANRFSKDPTEETKADVANTLDGLDPLYYFRFSNEPDADTDETLLRPYKLISMDSESTDHVSDIIASRVNLFRCSCRLQEGSRTPIQPHGARCVGPYFGSLDMLLSCHRTVLDYNYPHHVMDPAFDHLWLVNPVTFQVDSFSKIAFLFEMTNAEKFGRKKSSVAEQRTRDKNVPFITKKQLLEVSVRRESGV